MNANENFLSLNRNSVLIGFFVDDDYMLSRFS